MSAGKPRRRVTLELDTDREAIDGTLEHDNGQRERFWGWLELMAALQRVTASRPTTAATTKPISRDDKAIWPMFAEPRVSRLGPT
jgi:hypothetical protein